MSANSVTQSPKHVVCRGERFRLYLDRETIRNRVHELGEANRAATPGELERMWYELTREMTESNATFSGSLTNHLRLGLMITLSRRIRRSTT